MDPFFIVLRIAHVVGALLLVGSNFVTTVFLERTAEALGPDAQKFMSYLSNRLRFPQFVTAVAFITVGAGIWLYYVDSNGFSSSWMNSPSGIGFGLGGLAGILTLPIGAGVIAPTVSRIGKLGGELAAAGRPPTPEEQAQLRTLTRRLRLSSRAATILLLIAATFMAVSRYLR